MSVVARALWIIERHIERRIDLASLGESCAVSPFHLAHAFAQTTGKPLMQYVRARRLSRAAANLADGRADILELALASGYQSHEAFTRAFKSMFGRTPEQVRAAGTTARLALVEAFEVQAADAGLVPEGIRRPGPLLLAGQERRFSMERMSELPGFWREFGAAFGGINDLAEPAPVGMMGPVDEEGSFSYRCAALVNGSAEFDLKTWSLSAGRYVVFSHEDHVASLPATYAAIWDNALPRLGLHPAPGFTIERHRPRFDPLTGRGGVEVWVPLLGD